MQHAVDKIIFLTDWSSDQSVKKKSCQNHVAANLIPDRYDIWNPHTFASQGFAWEGLPNQFGIQPHFLARALPGRAYRINLESTHFFWPGLCLEGVPNELGIHCGPSLCIPYRSEGKGDQVGRRAPHTMLCWWSWMSLHPGPAPPTHFGC